MYQVAPFVFLKRTARKERRYIMKKEKSALLTNSLIWFGAGVSIAEILTGSYIAPLGFKTGFLAIITGHIIGFLLMFLVGLIGGREKKGAMETVRISFGIKGSIFFAVLNVIQLVGWTAVMIESGASAIEIIFSSVSKYVWCLIVGIAVLIWLIVNFKDNCKVNILATSLLFVLTLILSRTVLKGEEVYASTSHISFGAAVELSVAMPLSWLPLISDYTRDAKKPLCSSILSSGTYFFSSIWMYTIGLCATLNTGEGNIALIMSKAGLGIAALLIIIFSTITTTFLDVYSAGISLESISGRLKEKPMSVIVCILGIILAVFTPVSKFEEFLYLIGSVFAPMAAILITDYFILKKDISETKYNFTNFIIWVFGFIIYRLFMNLNTYIGYTFPAMLVIGCICIVTEKIKKFYINR